MGTGTTLFGFPRRLYLCGWVGMVVCCWFDLMFNFYHIPQGRAIEGWIFWVIAALFWITRIPNKWRKLRIVRTPIYAAGVGCMLGSVSLLRCWGALSVASALLGIALMIAATIVVPRESI